MIKYLFYTDCPIPSKKYPNIEFREISFKDYCSIVRQKLNIHFYPKQAYKLCDIRPFFGYLHEDDIAEYEFWSFGDLDLCYGNLNRILSDTNLKRYNLITTQDYHLAGHFTVLKNNDYFRNVGFRIPDWKRKLLEPGCIALDELDLTRVIYPFMKYPIGLYDKLIKRILPKSFHTIMKCYNRIFKPNMLFSMEYTSPEPKIGEKWLLDLKTNELTDEEGRKLPYLHFLFFKNHPDKTHRHWPKDYYQLTEPIEEYRLIEFTTEGIRGYK